MASARDRSPARSLPSIESIDEEAATEILSLLTSDRLEPALPADAEHGNPFRIATRG